MDPLPDRLPLVIGVTGHRDLRDQDIPALEREVAAIITALRHDYLHGDRETPLIILSSLAEGADRLVVRVALAHGARLIAPMPMPIEEYRRDFEPGLQAGNTAEFDALLAQAIAAPVVPFTPGNSLAGIRADADKRAEQYRAVGLFIAQHANVLVALWEGDGGAMATGGTAEVVAFKRRGIPLDIQGSIIGSARASLDASEIGPVIHVVTPRRKETSAAAEVSVRPWGRQVYRHGHGALPQRLVHAAEAFIANVLGRDLADRRDRLSDNERQELEAWETFEALATLTRTFNRDAAELTAPARPDRAGQSLDALFALGSPSPIDSGAARQTTMERAPRYARLYAIADALARRWQLQFGRDWMHLYVYALFAFFCFAFFSNVGVLSNLLLILYMLGFLGIFAVVVRAYVGQHQERFLDYRALAEALRVAIYWRILGLARPPGEAADPAESLSPSVHDPGTIADAYPIKQSSELAWVKIALRVLDLIELGDRSSERGRLDAAGHAVALHSWVRGQYAYFRTRGYRLKRQADAISAHGLLLAASAPFVIVPLVLAVTSPAPAGAESALRTILLVASGLLPGIGSIMNEYSERLALSARARQYDRMRMLFGRACELLPERLDHGSAALARAIYLELGQEAMRESAEWVSTYRQRPIQPPK
jgi:hypothetical protein